MLTPFGWLLVHHYLWRAQRRLQKMTSMAVTSILRLSKLLKGRSSCQRNNSFSWTYKYESLTNKGKSFSLQTHPQKFRFSYFRTRKLTSPSEGLWSVNPCLLWYFVYLFQARKFIEIRVIQLIDFSRIINWRCLWEQDCFTICPTIKRLNGSD